MKITILGCGSFFIDKEHSAPAYLLQTKNENILLDCGPGTMNQLAMIGFDPLDIKYIFITHFHADHTSDLFPVLTRFWVDVKSYDGKVRDLVIIGPKGIKGFVSKLGQIYELPKVIDYAGLKFLEYGEGLSFPDFSVESFSVEHLNIPAYSLRISLGDKIITYTGDAVLSGGVIDASKGADVLITDCATPKEFPPIAHLSTNQVGEICRDNGVKKVILSHQVPPGYNVDMVGEVKEVWDGDVTLAKDLMEIEL